jgi:hypothetical protein
MEVTLYSKLPDGTSAADHELLWVDVVEPSLGFS